ncbi:MAG: hypothetical protein ACI8TX_001868 [Hyphomicrobiaceae bacterium]|jgi:hypothetical protein
MKRSHQVLTAAIIVGAFAIVATTASAIPNRPFGARKFTAEFVKHYATCQSPNDVTANPFVSHDACNPPVEGVPSCGFGPAGKGKLKMKADVAAGDIDYKVKFKRLAAGCVGETLEFIIKYAATNNDCPGGVAGDCTAINVEETIGSCVVTASGTCVTTSSANAFRGGTLFQAGLETSIELHGCGMKVAGLNEVGFTCGLLID